MKKELLISVLTAGLLTITGCGSSNDSENSSDNNDVETPITKDKDDKKTPTVLSAQFIDAAVEGLAYDCQSSGKSGITNSQGKFSFVAGDTCTFKVGDVTIGSAKITGTTTPRTLTTVEPNLTNTLRFLQTLDSDEDPSNGITLPSGLSGNIDLGNNFDAEIQKYLDDNKNVNAVVDPGKAKDHFEQASTLQINNATFIDKTFSFTLDNFLDLSFLSDFTYNADGDQWKIINNELILEDGNKVKFFKDNTFTLTYLDGSIDNGVYTIKATENGNGNGNGNGENADLTGTWEWEWTIADQQQTLTFTESTLVHTVLSSGATSISKYTYIKKSSQILEQILTSSIVTIKDQKAVNGYNNAKYFGFSDWVINIPKDITSYYTNVNALTSEHAYSINSNKLKYSVNNDIDIAYEYTKK